MRHNLAKDSLESLNFIGEFHVDLEAFREEFDEYRKRTGGDYPLVFVATYSRSRQRHSAALLLSLDEQEQKCLAQIHFESSTSLPSTPKTIDSPEIGLAKLSSLIERIEFAADASFSYDVLRYKPKVPIPIKLPSDESAAFDEVLGIRVAKSDKEGEREYSAVVDLLGKKTINIHVRKSITCAAEPSEISTAKDDLIAISRRFVARN